MDPSTSIMDPTASRLVHTLPSSVVGVYMGKCTGESHTGKDGKKETLSLFFEGWEGVCVCVCVWRGEHSRFSEKKTLRV